MSLDNTWPCIVLSCSLDVLIEGPYISHIFESYILFLSTIFVFVVSLPLTKAFTKTD